MITTLFGKSKPINFLILGFVLSVFYTANRVNFTSEFFFTELFDSLLLSLVLFFCLWLLGFIIYKNKLTQSNHFALFFFVCLILGVMHLPISSKTIWPLVFVTLSLRRTLAIRTLIDIRKKVFDAAFWLTIGMLFNFWIVLFFILIYIALLYFEGSPSTLWLIPFTAIFSVLFPVFTYFFFQDEVNVFMEFFNYKTIDNQIFDSFSKHLLFLISNLTLALFSIYFYKRKLNLKASNQKKTRQLIIFGYFISIAVYLFSSQSHPDVILLTVPFLSILSVAFVEDFKNKMLAEAYLILILICMLSFLFW